MIRKRLTYCIGVFLFLLLASCDSNDRGAGTDAATYIPEAPDYADATMWYTRENCTADKGADVFYLVSTWETDWTTEDGRVCHFADVHNATHRTAPTWTRRFPASPLIWVRLATSIRPTTATSPSKAGQR